MPNRTFNEFYNSYKHIFLSWFFFSILYWIAAYNRPFHIDEYFSWVYTERCSFYELLMMKDTGIGHPPLYHLILKLFQRYFYLIPDVYLIRTANYFLGSIFIILIIKLLSKYKIVPIYYYAIATSATLLDSFIFSRMWGFVALAALLTFNFGERWIRHKSKSNLFFLLLAIVFGFLVDFNFILILPYVIIIFLHKKVIIKKNLLIILFIMFILILFSIYFGNIRDDISIKFMFFSFLDSILRLNFEILNLIFNFWFEETFFISLFLFILFLLHSKAKHKSNTDRNFACNLPFKIVLSMVLLLIFKYLLSYDLIRIRYLYMLIFIIFFYFILKGKIYLNLQQLQTRMACSILGANLLILIINPWFWRDLIDNRFLIVLLPFFFLIILLSFRKQTLNLMSGLIIISGILYSNSTAINDYFTPNPSPDFDEPIVYQDIFTYSTDYFKNDPTYSPYIIDKTGFEKYCRICEMGNDNIPFESFNSFVLLSRYYDEQMPTIPKKFRLYRTQYACFSDLDKFQLKYFTPIIQVYYKFYFFKK